MSDSITENDVLSETNSMDDSQAESLTMDTTTPNTISNDGIQTSSQTQSSRESDYEIGDIVWAKMGKYPFWPGVICMDPQSKTYFKSNENKNKINVHVRFCNDNGKRAWVNNIECYRGKDELMLKYPKNLSNVKNRDYLKKCWIKAVEEADNLMKLERKQRAINFFKTFSNSNPFDVSTESDLTTSSVKHKLSKKRSSTTSDHGHVSKIFKTENMPTASSNRIDAPLFPISEIHAMFGKECPVLKNPRKRKSKKDKNNTSKSEGPFYLIEFGPLTEAETLSAENYMKNFSETRLLQISALEESLRCQRK